MSRRRPYLKATSLWVTLLSLALWSPIVMGAAEATTIVVVRTPTEIYIGADSKITDIRDESLTSTACKIRQVGDLFFAFAGVQKRKPVFFMRHLKAVEKDGYPGITIYKKSCPGDCRHGKVIAYMGQTGALEGHMSDSSDVWKDGYIEGIRKLITLQIKAEPVDVGPPIDILQIRRQGARWIQVKSECPEVE